MKHLFILVLVFVSLIGLSQTKNDTVDFKNVNHALLNQLILEKCNQERVKVGADPLIKDKTCFMAAQYQSNYTSHFLIATHYNDNPFQGIKLYSPEDRVNYFSKKTNSKNQYDGEIFYSLYNVELYLKYTYDELAQKTIDGYMSSTPHRNDVLKNFKIMDFLSKYVSYGDFATSSNITNGKFNFYAVGVFTYGYK